MNAAPIPKLGKVYVPKYSVVSTTPAVEDADGTGVGAAVPGLPGVAVGLGVGLGTGVAVGVGVGIVAVAVAVGAGVGASYSVAV